MSNNELFIGTWRLVSSLFQLANGRIQHPLGPDATGLIMYDAQGYMAAQLMRMNRPKLSSRAETAELLTTIRTAFDGYTAYYGSYTIYPEKKLVIHHVQASMFPNWIGTDQERFYHFSNDGNQLTLTTPPIGPNDAKMVGTLVWQRLNH